MTTFFLNFFLEFKKQKRLCNIFTHRVIRSQNAQTWIVLDQQYPKFVAWQASHQRSQCVIQIPLQ